MAYNDDFKFSEWYDWYLEYKDDIALHVVVDNGSEQPFVQKIKEYFKDSVIIERDSNGGCTAAYNDGIKYVLTRNDIDAIALIGKDIRLKKGWFDAAEKLLYSKENYGVVGGVVLKKDSDEIECFGDTLNCIGVPKFNYIHGHISDLPDTLEVSYVGGGCNLAKREFYEKVGLQDTSFFMYNDEIDMYYRAKAAGYIEAVTKDAVAWHQHVPYVSKKDLTGHMAYLNGRNRVVIIKRYLGFWKGACMFLYMLSIETLVFLRDIKDAKTRKRYFSKWRGFIQGFKGNMDNSFMNE